jgi:hypothetical protein
VAHILAIALVTLNVIGIFIGILVDMEIAPPLALYSLFVLLVDIPGIVLAIKFYNGRLANLAPMISIGSSSLKLPLILIFIFRIATSTLSSHTRDTVPAC